MEMFFSRMPYYFGPYFRRFEKGTRGSRLRGWCRGKRITEWMLLFLTLLVLCFTPHHGSANYHGVPMPWQGVSMPWLLALCFTPLVWVHFFFLPRNSRRYCACLKSLARTYRREAKELAWMAGNTAAEAADGDGDDKISSGDEKKMSHR